MKHPIQKIIDHRFVENKIVSYLLDNGGIDLNKLAVLPFDDEDRQQFAQLIGYSVSGYAGLNYVSDEAYDTAARLEEKPELPEVEANNITLRNQLREARNGVKEAAVALFKIHPDDLTE